MSRLHATAATLLALAAAACGTSAGSPPGAGGRLRVERVTRPAATLLDDPGRALYCAHDSLLTLIAVGRAWTGGFAVRVVLPLQHPDTFLVGRALDSARTATAAFRAIGGPARFAVGGRLTLEAGPSLSGDFEVTVADTGGTDVLLRGGVTRVPVAAAPEGACPR
jgi:hypothetical protein